MMRQNSGSDCIEMLCPFSLHCKRNHWIVQIIKCKFPIDPYLTLTLIFQIIIVFFFNNAFRVRPLDAEQWLWCFFFGFSELLWGQIVFTIPKGVIPGKIRCCSKGVPPKQQGCCFFFRGIRSRDEVNLKNVLNIISLSNHVTFHNSNPYTLL